MARARRMTTAALLLAAAAGARCSSGPVAPHGAPVLLKVYWIAGGSRYLVWSPPGVTDPTLVISAPPFASRVDFVFDRRLDGARVEDDVTVNGVTTASTKANPPVTATWPQRETFMSDPPFALDVLYDSSAVYGGTSSYVFAQPKVIGFPSGRTVTFALDRSNLTNHYGEALAMPAGVPVVTGDFTVQLGVPAATDGGAALAVGTDFRVPLSFSNRPAGVDQLRPFVHARAAGVELPVDLIVDAQTPTLLYLGPAACLGAWPPGAVIEVAVDGAMPDAFHVPLGAGVTAAFTTGTGPRQPGDACAPADGGSDGP